MVSFTIMTPERLELTTSNPVKVAFSLLSYGRNVDLKGFS
jgi:hypothetical protein